MRLQPCVWARRSWRQARRLPESLAEAEALDVLYHYRALPAITQSGNCLALGDWLFVSIVRWLEDSDELEVNLSETLVSQARLLQDSVIL